MYATPPVTLYRKKDGKAITCMYEQVEIMLASGNYTREKEVLKPKPKPSPPKNVASRVKVALKAESEPEPEKSEES